MKKTKPYATIIAAIEFAKFHLGLRNWDVFEDQDRAVCWVDNKSGVKAARVDPAAKGGYKLRWDPQYEQRRPKMLGM